MGAGFAGRAPRWLALVAAVGLLASGCGGSPLTAGAPAEGAPQTEAEKVFAKFNAMSGQERHDALVAAAKAEGELSLYGAPESSAQLIEIFQEKYGIKVNLLSGQTEERAQRFIQEETAGRHAADFVVNVPESLAEFERLGLLGTYESPARDTIPDEGRGTNWTAFYRVAFVAGYNTTVVDPAEMPGDFADFADPKWKGRISMELGDFSWFMALFGHYRDKGMSDAEVTDLFERIATNAKVVTGHSAQASLLTAGQFGVAVSAYTQSLEREKAKGAPVAWKGDGTPTTQPVVLTYVGGCLSRNAPHPAAALLYMDFLLSPDANPAYAADKILPAIPPDDDPLKGLATVSVDPERLTTEQAKWSDLYDAVLRKGSQ